MAAQFTSTNISFFAQALRVDGVGHQFFARAGLAINQHAAVGRRHELNLLAQRLHGNALADDHAAWARVVF